MHVIGLRVERRGEHDTLGVWERRPRLSWRTDTDARDWYQQAYEIEAVDADGGGGVWRSGRVASDESHLVAWGGGELASRQRVRWRVTVEGRDGASATSEWATFELGLLDDSDWSAAFVVPDVINAADPAQPVAYVRREFEGRRDVVRARLHVTALGVYECELNGMRVGDQVLAPGWSAFQHRVRVETFDVTDLVRAGAANAIGVMLADGWYGERYGFDDNPRRLYCDELALIAQLELVDTAGATHRIVTDDSWRSSTGPIGSSGIYNGETYDARRELDGWSQPGFDDGAWSAVHRYDGARGALVGRSGPPVRRTEEVAPVAIATSPSGKTIVDFGQNLVGRIRLRVEGEAGTTITLRHAEVLEGGELLTRILRRAAATDRYTLRGDAGGEEWEPRFTFHGFRYAEITGWPGELSDDALRAVVCHSDMERTGWFECSDERVNQLHRNIVWGMRGNFLDVPTDCPQRAERMGWTGDINVFTPTATFLFDVDGFLSCWLADLAAQQGRDGSVPFVIPDAIGGAPTAVWGDAATVVPWVLYERYRDLGVLDTQYASMRAWVECVAKRAGRARLWDRGFQFGDWVDPASPPDKPADARTDAHLVAQAAWYHSIDLLTRTARLLGNDGDVRRYERLGAQVRRAFAKEYATPNGRLASDAQTAYAIAIHWDLLDGAAREHAGDRLAYLVFKEGFRIGTGFVGTPVLCDALCETGHADAAYALLEQAECPSWLYPVLQGATTIWERWDALRPDGTVNPGEMNSFNHYALGAVGDWLHRTVAGLAPAAPGYRALDVRIRPGGSLTHARAAHVTPYGRATVAWRVDDGALHADVVVPPNTTAAVALLDDEPIEVGSGRHTWTVPFKPSAP
jgi:alpha-L-rhamnosidase